MWKLRKQTLLKAAQGGCLEEPPKVNMGGDDLRISVWLRENDYLTLCLLWATSSRAACLRLRLLSTFVLHNY